MTTILIIEDTDDIRENVAEILSLSGYRVFEADNGRDGAALAVRHLPDLILCDIMMDDLDGYGDSYSRAQLSAICTVGSVDLRASGHWTTGSATRLFPGVAGSRFEAAATWNF